MDELNLDLIQALTGRIALSRPLVLIDLESTGLNTDVDRIVEFGAVKIRPAGGDTTAFLRRFNPGIPISPDATAVHGITDADVANEKPFRDMAKVLFDALTDVDLAGYNLKRFDVKILQAEFLRAGLTWTPGRLIDCYGIWGQKERRDLAGAVRRFAPSFDGEAGGHTAVGDILGVAAVLTGQIDMFWPTAAGAATKVLTVDELQAAGTDPDEIDGGDGKIAWRNGRPAITVGKYAGTAVADLPSGYVEWLTFRSEFPDSVKRLVTDIRRGKGPVRD